MAKETRRQRDLRLLKAKAAAAKKRIAEEKKNRSYFDIRDLTGTYGQPGQDAVRYGQTHTPKPGTVESQREAIKGGAKGLKGYLKEKFKPVTGHPMIDPLLGDIRAAQKGLLKGKSAQPRRVAAKPKRAKAPAKAEPVKAKAPAKAKAAAKAKPFTSTESLAASERRFGDVDPPPFSREASALATYSSKKKAPAKAQPKPQAKAKAASLKGAPRPELPKKSDPEYKAKLSKFRKWYTANRSSPKKRAVAQPVIKPAKKAVVSKKTTPSRTADLTALETRIKMKRESGQAIPASWLKAEKVAKAKAKVAKVAQASKRIPSSIDRLENEKEAASGRADMARWKSGVASAKAKRLEAGQRKVADAKAQAEAHNQKARAIKASKSRIAETKAKKADAQARLAKLKAAEEKRKRKAAMSALPGFRSN